MDTTVQLPRYNAPGWADRLDRDLLRRWNETIADIYQRKSQELLYRRPVAGRENATLATPFFVLGPSAQLEGEVAITARWPADPLGAVNCVGQPLAKELDDHGSMGRRLHDDYCEYLVVRGRDRRGRDRPKRVQVTTELREYWLCIARYDPPAVRRMAAGILGFRPTWKQLYGGDPERLDEEERTLGFARLVAGNGEDKRLEDAGVPEVPVGPLNTEHLLFLRHPANGLDDLAEILLLGAHPYAAGRPRRPQAADPEVIFSALGAPEFSCRRADPVFLAEGQDAALNGSTLVPADPLGISILGFSAGAFHYRGAPLPERWIRWSRGDPSVRQRLEVGPDDDEDVFLDDIEDGTDEQPLTGGYQILRQLEVGVHLLRGAPLGLPAQLDRLWNRRSRQLCSAADLCTTVQEVLDDLRGHTPSG